MYQQQQTIERLILRYGVQTVHVTHAISCPAHIKVFLPLRLKHPKCEAEQSFPAQAEVKNVWRFTSALPVHSLHTMIRQGDNI